MSNRVSDSELTAQAFQAAVAQANNPPQEQDNVPTAAAPTVAAPVVEPPKADTQPDVHQTWLKEQFGTDDVNAVKERYTGYENLQKTVTDKEAEAQRFQKEAADYKIKAETNPFANDFVKGLNELARNGASPKTIDAYVKVNQVDLSTLPPKEKVALRMQLEKGLSQEDINLLLDNEYSINESLYDDEVDETVRTAKLTQAKRLKEINLNLAASDADKYLGDFKKSLGGEDPAKIKQKEDYQNYISQVKQLAPDIQKTYEGMKSVTLIPAKDGQEAVTLDIVPNDAFKNAIPQYVESFMAQNNVPLTQEGIQSVRNHLNMVYVAQNFSELVQTAAQHAANEREKTVRLEYSNPTKRTPDTGAGGGGGRTPHPYEASLAKYEQERPHGKYRVERTAKA